MSAPALKVICIEARNVLGAREFIVRPGSVTKATGRNGSGKSTTMEIVRAALGGGSLGSIARLENDVAQEPEIVLILGEPGSTPETAEYRVRKNATRITVEQRVENNGTPTRAFKEIPRPQSFLNGLFDEPASNPIAFLTAADKDLIPMILNAIPLDLPEGRIAEILGEDAAGIAGLDRLAALHPIEQLVSIREALFTTRTGVHRDRDGAKRTADRIKQSVPAIIETEKVRAELAAVEAQAKELRATISGHRTAIDMEKTAAEATATAAYKNAVSAADAELKRAVAEAETVNARACGEARRQLAESQRMAFEAKANRDESLRADVDQCAQMDTKTVELRGALELSAKNQTLADEAAIAEKDEERHRAHAARLTAKMKAIDDLQRQLADNLPVSGLEIRPACEPCLEAKVRCPHAGIYIDGVPQRQANEAQRVKTFMDVALLRSAGTPLPWVVVDGANALDDETLAAIESDLAMRPDVQAFISFVANEDLSLTSDGKTAGHMDLKPNRPRKRAS